MSYSSDYVTLNMYHDEPIQLHTSLIPTSVYSTLEKQQPVTTYQNLQRPHESLYGTYSLTYNSNCYQKFITKKGNANEFLS